MDLIDLFILVTLFAGAVGICGAAVDLTILWNQRRGPFNPYRRIR